MHPSRQRNKTAMLALVLAIVLTAGLLAGCGAGGDGENLRIGAQNYAEVIIMAYAAEALIEDQTDHNVEVVPRLGSIVVLDQAMESGEVDIASLMFTGGAGGILHPALEDQVDFEDEKWRDEDHVWEFLSENAPEALGRLWLQPLGYENTYAITVRQEMAEEYGLEKVSDLRGLSQDLVMGMDDAYMDRPVDGYPVLLEWYDLEPFQDTVSMQINLLYQALRDGELDVGVAYSSDARIMAYDLVWLEDDLNIYPPYYAGYNINLEAAERAPEVPEILEQLSGQVDIETMQRLNYEVDINQRDHQEVAIEFLKEIGLLE